MKGVQEVKFVSFWDEILQDVPTDIHNKLAEEIPWTYGDCWASLVTAKAIKEYINNRWPEIVEENARFAEYDEEIRQAIERLDECIAGNIVILM